MNLKECLARCLVVELRAIARQHELRLQSLLKADIISQLERKILSWVGDGKYQRSMADAPRSALSMVLDHGGSIKLSDLEAAFGEFRRAVPGGIESSQPWSDGHSTPPDQLHVWGLLFHDETGGQEARACIPAEVLEILRPAPPTRPSPFRACAAPPAPAEPSPYLCQDLMLLASALRSAPANRLSGGGIARRDMLRLNSHLLSPDEIADAGNERSARRLSFLRSLALHLGLISDNGDRIVAEDRLESWLCLPHRDRHVSVIRGFLEMTEQTLLDDISTVRFESPPQFPVLSAARRFLMALVTEADFEEWQLVSSLAQTSRARNSLLLRRPGDGSSVRCAETGRILTARDWMLVEGAWIEAMVRGPLYWLGVLEPGRTRRGELTCFRLVRHTAPIVGQAIGQPDSGPALEDAGREMGSGASPTASVTVDFDLVVRVGCDVNPARWYRLERLCDLLERGAESRYRLSREKVRQALQAGVTQEMILSDLGAEIPEAAAATLSTWSNRFGQVRVFRTGVLSAADAALMSELRSIPEVVENLADPLGTRASAILPGKESAVVTALRKRGEMPHVEERPVPAGLCHTVVQELRHALDLWQSAAKERGLAPPSEVTVAALARLARELDLDPIEPASEPGDSPTASGHIDSSMLEDAISRKRTIIFDYADPARSAATRLVVSPKRLGQKHGLLYLSGYRKGGAALEQFRLDFIRNIQ